MNNVGGINGQTPTYGSWVNPILYRGNVEQFYANPPRVIGTTTLQSGNWIEFQSGLELQYTTAGGGPGLQIRGPILPPPPGGGVPPPGGGNQ